MVTPLEALKAKYMKDPDIIPAEGQDKEVIVEAMAEQQIRQKKNNERAFELLTKAGSGEIADPGGGTKAGGDSAMYRLTEFVQKPVEKTELDRKMWGDPTKKHLDMMNRPLKILNLDDVDNISLDAPPIDGSDEQRLELKQLEELSGLLSDDQIKERIDTQDEDLLEVFDRYLRDNNLTLDKERIKKIMKDVNTVLFRFKFFFNRPRPHQSSDQIEEIENTAGKSPSYPSGHSTAGAVIAEILADDFPEHAESLRVIGTEIGYNRVIAGLHYLSDHIAGLNLAGQLLSLALDKDVKKSDGFMDELFKYMAHRENLLKDMTQIGTQDILDGVRIDKEKQPIEKHSDEHHTVEHTAEEKPFSMDDAKQDLKDQIQQIKNKIETGDYQIEKFLVKAKKNKKTKNKKTKKEDKTPEYVKKLNQILDGSEEIYGPDNTFNGLENASEEELGNVVEALQRHDSKYQVQKVLQDEFGIKSTTKDNERIYTLTTKPSEIIKQKKAAYAKDGRTLTNPNVFNTILRGFAHNKEEPKGNRSKEIEYHDIRKLNTETNEFESSDLTTFKDDALKQTDFNFDSEKGTSVIPEGAEIIANSKTPFSIKYTTKLPDGAMYQFEIPTDSLEMAGTFTSTKTGDEVNTYKLLQDYTSLGLLPNPSEENPHTFDPEDRAFADADAQVQFKDAKEAIANDVRRVKNAVDLAQKGFLDYAYNLSGLEGKKKQFKNLTPDDLQQAQDNFADLLESGESGDSDILDHFFNRYLEAGDREKYKQQFEASKLESPIDVVSEDSPIPVEEFNRYVDEINQLIEDDNFIENFVKNKGSNALSEAKDFATEAYANLDNEFSPQVTGLGSAIKPQIDRIVEKLSNAGIVTDSTLEGFKQNFESTFDREEATDISKITAINNIGAFVDKLIDQGKTIPTGSRASIDILTFPGEVFAHVINPTETPKPDADAIITEVSDKGKKDQTPAAIQRRREAKKQSFTADGLYDVDGSPINLRDKYYFREDVGEGSVIIKGDQVFQKTEEKIQSLFNDLLDRKNIKDNKEIKPFVKKLIENLNTAQESIKNQVEDGKINAAEANRKVHDILKQSLVDGESGQKAQELFKKFSTIKDKDDSRVRNRTLESQLGFSSYYEETQFKKDNLSDTLDKHEEDLIQKLEKTDNYKNSSEQQQQKLEEEITKNVDQMRSFAVESDGMIDYSPIRNKKDTTGLSAEGKEFLTQETQRLQEIAGGGGEAVKKHLVEDAPQGSKSKEQPGTLSEKQRAKELLQAYGYSELSAKTTIDKIYALHENQMNEAAGTTPKETSFLSIDDIDRIKYENMHKYAEKAMGQSDPFSASARVRKLETQVDENENSILGVDPFSGNYAGATHNIPKRPGFTDYFVDFAHKDETTLDQLNSDVDEYISEVKEIQKAIKNNKAIESLTEKQQGIYEKVEQYSNQSNIDLNDMLTLASKSKNAGYSNNVLRDGPLKKILNNYQTKLLEQDTPTGDQIELSQAGNVETPFSYNERGELQYNPDSPAANEETQARYDRILKSRELKENARKPDIENETIKKDLVEYHNKKASTGNDTIVAPGIVVYKASPSEDKVTKETFDKTFGPDYFIVDPEGVVRPSSEEPKAEEPKAEEPKVEQPKVEQPKAEEPKVEEPKAEDKESDEDDKVTSSSRTPDNTPDDKPTGGTSATKPTIVDAFREGGNREDRKETQHAVVQLEDGTLQTFARNPSTDKFAPHDGVINTGKNQGLHLNSHFFFGLQKNDPLRGYGHQLLLDVAEQLDQGVFDSDIQELENPLFRKDFPGDMVYTEIKPINDRLKGAGVNISNHIENSYENPIADPTKDFKTKEGAEILGTLNSMAGASDTDKINAYRDFWYHNEYGKFNSSNGQVNFEEILKQYKFDRTDPPNKNKDGKTEVTSTVDPETNLAIPLGPIGASGEERKVLEGEFIAGGGKIGPTGQGGSGGGGTTFDGDYTIIDDNDGSGDGQRALGSGQSDAEDAGEVKGFSDYLQELLPLVPEQNRTWMEDALTDEQLAQRIEDVYEDKVKPDNREIYPIQEWLKNNVLSKKTSHELYGWSVDNHQKIKPPTPPKEPPAGSAGATGEAGDGGTGGDAPAGDKQFSEEDATRIAGELSNELESMPELFTYTDGTQKKTATANNRTMSQRARRLHRMINLDSHPEIHEKLSKAAKNKLTTENNGLNKHLPKKIIDQINTETQQYDKDTFYDHKDDSKQHNQDIEAKRQASAVNEQAHDKKVKEIHKQGANHEIFQSDTHKKNMQLQEWTGGEGGSRDMEAEFDQFMEKKYGADYSKDDAAKERKEQGLPPGAPRPRLVKDKDGVQKFLGYYLWHAASRHWVTPEYAKLHPDLAGGAGAGNVVTFDPNLKDGSGAQAYQPHDDAARDAGIAGFVTQEGVMQLANKKGDRDEFDNRTFNNFSNVNDHLSDEDAEYRNTLASVVEDKLNEIRGGAGGVATGDKGQRIASYKGGSPLANYSARMSAAGGFKGALSRFVSTITPESLGGGPVKEQYLGRGSREE